MIPKVLIQLFIAAAIVYVVFGLFLFFAQRSLLYYPDQQIFEDCEGFADYEKVIFEGTRIYYKEQSEHLVVYYHGNAGSACDRSIFKNTFEHANKSVIFVEYAGYSNDDKKPSAKLVLKDVERVHEFLRQKNFTHITVYGQSIGTGAASYHAHLGGVDALILVTPFTSLHELAQKLYPLYPVKLLLQERYDNDKWLEDFEGRVLIMHGEDDDVIPYQLSQKLYASLITAKKEYVLIRGRGHNDLWSSEEFIRKLEEFL